MCGGAKHLGSVSLASLRATGSPRPPHFGLTLIEILVAVTILFLLLSIVIVTGRIASNATKRSTAQQQMSKLASAIDQYATFWPRWHEGSVVVADKGWPDFIAGRLFAAPFAVVAGFNDYIDLANPSAGADNLLNANECLAYCLTNASGHGPYIKPDVVGDGLQQAKRTDGQPELYPALSGYGAAPRQRFVDPWGTPLRYFWVYRDPSAYRGYLPVMTADQTSPNFHTAVGFVLESAGPNKKYGDVWQLTPSADIADAEDNLIISP